MREFHKKNKQRNHRITCSGNFCTQPRATTHSVNALLHAHGPYVLYTYFVNEKPTEQQRMDSFDCHSFGHLFFGFINHLWIKIGFLQIFFGHKSIIMMRSLPNMLLLICFFYQFYYDLISSHFPFFCISNIYLLSPLLSLIYWLFCNKNWFNICILGKHILVVRVQLVKRLCLKFIISYLLIWPIPFQNMFFLFFIFAFYILTKLLEALKNLKCLHIIFNQF